MDKRLNTTIRDNIYKGISELADIELQKKLWLNINNNTNMISSYTEVHCRLFDDNALDYYLDNNFEAFELSELTVKHLLKLRDELNNYSEHGTDKEIIEDSKWEIVVNQAKKVIAEWDKN